MCLIHDLGEAIHGDIPAPQQNKDVNKAANEREDLAQILAPLPEEFRSEFSSIWEEYEAAATEEAKLAKALDKLETLIQHNQGKNPVDFDYDFNLDYGKRHTDYHAITRELRAIVDEETRKNRDEG